MPDFVPDKAYNITLKFERIQYNFNFIIFHANIL